MRRPVHFLTFLAFFSTFVLIAGFVRAQNGLIGQGFGTNDWSTTDGFNGSAGNSRIGTFKANGNGNQYFRLVTNLDGNYNQWGPSSTSDDYPISINTEVPASEIIENSTSKAYVIDVDDYTTYNYIFKTKEGGNPPTNKGLIVFEVQGAIRSVSGVSASLLTIYPGQSVTITATLDDAFNTGQGVYLRYTNDDFSTSGVAEMTGSGTSYTASIPSSVNGASKTVKYYVFTSGNGLSITGDKADWYTINLNNVGGTNYYYTVQSSWITAANGNWSSASTWNGNAVPPDNQPVTIDHDITLDQNAIVSSITINSGKTFTASDNSSRTLTINSNANGTTLTNNGTWTKGSGASNVSFEGTAIHTVSGTIHFYNVYTVTKVNFGSASYIDNIFQINANGSVDTNAPYYEPNSTLVYNTGSVFVAATEWYANFTSGQGIPQNVQIGTSSVDNSGLDFGTNTLYRLCLGDLTIGSSSGSGYSFRLSSNAGGDVKVGGNWTRYTNAGFYPQGRAVFFNGSGDQTIAVSGSGSNTEVFSYLISDKTGGKLIISSTSGSLTDISVDGNNSGSGDQLQLISATDLDLNGRTLYLAGSGGGNILTSGGVRNITGSAGSTVYVQSSKTVTDTSGGTLVFGDQVIVIVENNSVTTDFNVGASLTTINGTLRLNLGYQITNSPSYGSASLLQYNSGGYPPRGPEWMTGSGYGYPNDVSISNNTALDPGGASLTGTTLDLARDLTIESGSAIYMDYSGHHMTVPLTVGRHLILAGNLSLSGSIGGDIKVGGNWTHTAGTFTPAGRAVYFNGATGDQTITKSGGETFDYLIVDKTTSGEVILANDITVNQILTLTKGLITTGSNKVTLTSTGSTAGASSASYVNGTLVQTFASTVSKSYPIGKGGNYRPLVFNYTSLTGTSEVSAEQFEEIQPGSIPPGVTLAENRHWKVSQEGGSGFSYHITLDPTGIPGTGVVTMLKYESEVNSRNLTAAPNYTNQTAFSSLTGVNAFALADDCTVEVISTGGTSPVCYPTIEAAFDAINAGTHTNEITVEIHGSTTETSTATLNASGSGSASYSGVTIYPTLTGLSIGGDLNAPLLELNGADNVTIDGRVNASGTTKDLTVVNANTGTGASTIRFVNSACENKVQYCKIRGTTTNLTGGVVEFLTAVDGTGNIENIISYNDIAGYGSNRPVNAVYSSGSESRPNSNNTVHDNNIYNFCHPGYNSNGVFISSNSTNWIISDNSLYDTLELNPSSSSIYTGIRIVNEGISHQITGNFIGGNAPECSGTWIKNANNTNIFYGIFHDAYRYNKIQSNTIKSFSWSNSGASNWTGIHSEDGIVLIGGEQVEDGNIIGEETGNESIIIKQNQSGSTVYGIYAKSTDSIIIKNNSIGSLKIISDDPSTSSHFSGIYCVPAGPGVIYPTFNPSISILNNLVGSLSTPSSIQITITGSNNMQNLTGIFITPPLNPDEEIGRTTVNIFNNTIANLYNASNDIADISSIQGIKVQAGKIIIIGNQINFLSIDGGIGDENNSSAIGINIPSAHWGEAPILSQNTITNLINSHLTAKTTVKGIFILAKDFSGYTNRNYIASLSSLTSNSDAEVHGIYNHFNSQTISNNIVNLNGTVNAAKISGITLDYNSSVDVVFNTVSISGTSTSASSSFAFKTDNFLTDPYISSNIFSNTRESTGNNYSIWLEAEPWYSDHNNYHYGPSGTLGYLYTDITSLNDWQSATYGDQNSIAKDPEFLSLPCLIPEDFKPLTDSLLADSTLGITTDYFGMERCFPTMGAIDVVTEPIAPDTIFGKITLCPNEITNYSVSEVPFAFHGYKWTVPEGWEIISGQGTTEVQIKAGNSSQSGEISVSGVNECGEGEPFKLFVTIIPGPTTSPIYHD